MPSPGGLIAPGSQTDNFARPAPAPNGLIARPPARELDADVISAALTLALAGNITLAANLLFSAASAKIIAGATSLLFRNNADSATNVSITDAGLVTVARSNLALTLGNLIFGAASAKVIPGPTSFLFRDNGDANTNLSITDAGAVAVRGALTPTGGIAAAGGFAVVANLLHTGAAPAQVSTDGNDTTPSVTETYVCAVNVPFNASLTGVSIFNGSATGSGNVTVFIANSSGVVVANSASTAIAGTDVYQRIPFTGTYAAKGPATYFVATQYNNTASRFNTHSFGDFPAGKITGTVYGTLVSFAAPTTFTAAQGPIATLY